MHMDKHTFARWSWERDWAVGVANPWTPKIRAVYVSEAEYYLTLKRSEWPCGILLKMGADEHAHYHVGCPTTDPLE